LFDLAAIWPLRRAVGRPNGGIMQDIAGDDIDGASAAGIIERKKTGKGLHQYIEHGNNGKKGIL
jgi:hypothetical protein